MSIIGDQMQINGQLVDNILSGVTRPARYTGGEWNSIVKDWDHTPLRTALVYPDLYEIGASNLAIPILYHIINSRTDALAERAYCPWPDMAASLRSSGIPLYSLESKRPLSDFDIIGFSLEYELTYTNVLEVLALSGVPVFTKDRTDSHPFIIGGGTCCLNPEPVAEFFDILVVGEGEEIIVELLDLLREWKSRNKTKSLSAKTSNRHRRQKYLEMASGIEGVYIPSFYKTEYHENGMLKGVYPEMPGAKAVIKRRIVDTLPPPVVCHVVPYIEVVQDRVAIEIQRGCTRGCRFCQAGVIYRPLRERTPGEVIKSAGELIRNTGYRELSLLSLNTTDYKGIDILIKDLIEKYRQEKLDISLPSSRIDSFSLELMEALSRRKKMPLTFAPEAGSERLRCVINKAIKDETIMETAQGAFNRGWNNFKLYFMVGLPTETQDDLEGIIDLVKRLRGLPFKAGSSHPQIKASLSSFVPKAHTPLQWFPQNSLKEILGKYDFLKRGLRKTGAQLSWNSPQSSRLEGVFSRGDRRLGEVIYRGWQAGCKFDAWSEHFSYEKWLEVFEGCGMTMDFYANREREQEEIFPWNHIDTGVSLNFLKREYKYTLTGIETSDCRYGRCHACGLEKWSVRCMEKLKGVSASSDTV
ncbi:TIGR03960 family B12-binding radical SAM protein [Chloroflexota bacterium]